MVLISCTKKENEDTNSMNVTEDAMDTNDDDGDDTDADASDENNTDTSDGDNTDDDVSLTAEYKLIFFATWSSKTHPTDFPSGSHFSGLIGMTHNKDGKLFSSGEKASQGIINMAETGSKSLLQDEINTLIKENKAKTLISGGGIGSSPGQVELTFSTDTTHPLVSVVSMIAPSPDWFIAIKNVNLFEEGKWKDTVEVEVLTYDAGSDAGPTFTSPNADEDIPIELINTPPLADDQGKVEPLGTIKIIKN